MDAVDLIAKHVPAPWFHDAVDAVAGAAHHLVSPHEKRELVVDRLMRTLHVPEHLARLLVELAVLFLKDSPARQSAPDHERAD